MNQKYMDTKAVQMMEIVIEKAKLFRGSPFVGSYSVSQTKAKVFWRTQNCLKLKYN